MRRECKTKLEDYKTSNFENTSNIDLMIMKFMERVDLLCKVVDSECKLYKDNRITKIQLISSTYYDSAKPNIKNNIM